MQITIKSTKIIKQGERKDGTPYKWCSVMADDGSEKGTEYTTFDTNVLKQNPGAVIDIGDPQTKEGKLSFKKVVTVVSEGQASINPAPGPNGNGNMSKEDWGNKQKIERASFEAQTAVKEILHLAAVVDFEHAGELFKDDYNLALTWCGTKIKANMDGQVHSEIKTRLAPTEKTEPGESNGVPTSVGEMFAEAKNQGILRPDVLKKFGIPEEEVPKIIVADLWPKIVEEMIKAGATE